MASEPSHSSNPGSLFQKFLYTFLSIFLDLSSLFLFVFSFLFPLILPRSFPRFLLALFLSSPIFFFSSSSLFLPWNPFSYFFVFPFPSFPVVFLLSRVSPFLSYSPRFLFLFSATPSLNLLLSLLFQIFLPFFLPNFSQSNKCPCHLTPKCCGVKKKPKTHV